MGRSVETHRRAARSEAALRADEAAALEAARAKWSLAAAAPTRVGEAYPAEV